MQQPLSRRRFAQLAGLGVAAALLKRPALSAAPSSDLAPSIIRLSANENPYGPSARALQAMHDASHVAWRYPDEHNAILLDRLAKLNGVGQDGILLGDGSGEILQLCAAAFTSPDRKLIAADPTFEAILRYAETRGAGVVKVPLTSSYAHDLGGMNPDDAGLIYICNPNNPTASITAKDDLRGFIAQARPDAFILVDEAYFHFADSPDYESVIPLVNDHPNLIVARTFSKIYGMAGLRCGYAVAQKATIDRMRRQQMWDSVNCAVLAAAAASLEDNEQVTKIQHLNAQTRAFTLETLRSSGYNCIPSQANFVMFDTNREVAPLIAALKARGVEVGRVFPAVPTCMRVTIGKRSEMQSFLDAFRQVIG